MDSRRVLWCAVAAFGWLGASSDSIAQDCLLTEQSRLCPQCLFGEDTIRFGQSVAMDGPYMIGGSLKTDEMEPKRQAGIVTYDADVWALWWGANGGKIPGGPQVEYFHSNVAIDGNWAMMGAPQFSGQYVRVAEYSGSSWGHYDAPVYPDDPWPTNRFGNAIAISANTAVIGCFHDGQSEQGSAYIFRYEGDLGEEAWTQKQKITAGSSNPYDYFGHDVDVLGDVVAVGSPGAPGLKGKVCMFRYDSGQSQWLQEGSGITPGDAVIGDEVGYAVAMSNDGSDEILVIGAPDAEFDNEDSGAAYVYGYSGSSWQLQQKLGPPDPDNGMRFGCSVDIDGDIIIVGAKDSDIEDDPPNIYQAGSAYVFKLNEGTWEEEAKLLASDPGTNHYFGVSVAVTVDDREKFVVGASGHDGAKGALY